MVIWSGVTGRVSKYSSRVIHEGWLCDFFRLSYLQIVGVAFVKPHILLPRVQFLICQEFFRLLEQDIVGRETMLHFHPLSRSRDTGEERSVLEKCTVVFHYFVKEFSRLATNDQRERAGEGIPRSVSTGREKIHQQILENEYKK